MKLQFVEGKSLQNVNVATDLKALETFKNIINSPEFGFFHLTDDHTHIEKTKAVYQKFKHKKNFIQVGIGGSSLGPEMLLKPLKKSDVHFTFINNVDADELYDQLRVLSAKDTLFYIVSKSGGTAETLAGMQIAANWLKSKGVEEKEFKNHFVFCTDPVKGDLRALANKEGYECLEIPSNIGGRFSVFTAVGLLPAIFAGIDLEALFAGANSIKKQLLESSVDNPLLKLSAQINAMYEQGVHQTVLMPYSSKLRDLSFWFVQLWAESLGKEGKGLTPVPAYGPTDQHSQVQLFMEGPYDKFLFLIGIKNRTNDFSLKGPFEGKAFELLNGHSLNQLMYAELQGTLMALDEAKKPYLYWEWENCSELEVGQAVIFFESLTAVVGKHFFKIDPFNQPGVEAGKKFAFEWLKKL